IAGILIRYGQPEDWKGKPRSSRKGKKRTPRKDGRPPDTSKELVGRGRKGVKKSSNPKAPSTTPAPSPPPPQPIPRYRPSYVWDRNSCYLDTSLELIFQVVSRGFEHQFVARANTLHPAESLKGLVEFMVSRKRLEDVVDETTLSVSQTLGIQRTEFRRFLKRTLIVPEPYNYNPLFGWLDSIVSHSHDREQNFARSYFQMNTVLFRTCTGDEQSPTHFHLRTSRPQPCVNLTGELARTYRGDVSKWFRDAVDIDRSPEKSPSCWRNVDNDGERTCVGAATVIPLVLGIPVMLILELPGAWDGILPNQWNFPRQLRPLLTVGAETNGVVYDIVGRAFTNGGHFRADFTPDGRNVYAYDDMQHGGYAVLDPSAQLDGLVPPTSGWRTYAVVYHLRGGTRAQSFFTQYQVTAARHAHSIKFAAPSVNDAPYTVPKVVGLDRPNLTELTGEDRFWLTSPWRADMLDFVSTQPLQPKSSKRRVHFATDGETDMSDHQWFADLFLLAGKGALARHGIYWYPVRLISKASDGWVVSWWRGNQFYLQPPPANTVAETDLRDELWANAAARRQLRLGRWTHACEAKLDDDELFEFRDEPYTDEIEKALQPHLTTLEDLLSNPDAEHPQIPAAVWSNAMRTAKSQKGGELFKHGGVPYSGASVKLQDCARIANWFYHHVDGAQKSLLTWVGCVPLAHAYTIVIAYRNREHILDQVQDSQRYSAMDRQTAIFEIAWDLQKTPTARLPDIDHECLNAFEERLFEHSFAAGRAGNHQWGLDAGAHQENWFPYAGIPAYWDHDDREDESESELVVSLSFSLYFPHSHSGLPPARTELYFGPQVAEQ
ncbi:hypothetical protein C8R46DRAFT_899417, partial [Mycena filopes]